jgi:DNA gyrase subunit A
MRGLPRLQRQFNLGAQPVAGRATQGVTLISVDEGTRLSGLQRIAESDSDDDADESGDEVDTAGGESTPDA